MTTHPEDTDGNVDLVTFRLGGEICAVPASQLREVLEPVAMTRVPGAAEFVAGLINVRGTVVPLSDLRVPLGMPREPAGEHARIMVMDIPVSGQSCVVGILADAVHEVTRLDPEKCEQVPTVGARWPQRFVSAVGRWKGDLVTLPDLATIFEDFLDGFDGRTTLTGARRATKIQEPERA
jgi:purine-binding chemotaxis protein CheW